MKKDITNVTKYFKEIWDKVHNPEFRQKRLLEEKRKKAAEEKRADYGL
jgi:hypothetical protein